MRNFVKLLPLFIIPLCLAAVLTLIRFCFFSSGHFAPDGNAAVYYFTFLGFFAGLLVVRELERVDGEWKDCQLAETKENFEKLSKKRIDVLMGTLLIGLSSSFVVSWLFVDTSDRFFGLLTQFNVTFIVFTFVAFIFDRDNPTGGAINLTPPET